MQGCAHRRRRRWNTCLSSALSLSVFSCCVCTLSSHVQHVLTPALKDIIDLAGARAHTNNSVPAGGVAVDHASFHRLCLLQLPSCLPKTHAPPLCRGVGPLWSGERNDVFLSRDQLAPRTSARGSTKCIHDFVAHAAARAAARYASEPRDASTWVPWARDERRV